MKNILFVELVDIMMPRKNISVLICYLCATNVIKGGFACDWQCYLDGYQDLQNAFGENNVISAENHWNSHGQSVVGGVEKVLFRTGPRRLKNSAASICPKRREHIFPCEIQNDSSETGIKI